MTQEKNEKDYGDQPKPEEGPEQSSNTRLLTPSEIESMRKDICQSIQLAKGRFKDLA